jgi:hypothetical protein
MTRRTFTLLIVFAAGAMAQRPNPGPSPRPNTAMEAALKQIIPITTGVREDDHPAIASGGGRVWIAWVSFSETELNTQIYARSMEDGKWSEPIVVSESPGDYHKPAVTVDASGAVWIAWPAQVRGNWDIYGRVLREKWSKTERLTTDAGPDLSPQLAASKEGVLLVWQGVRKKNLDILYRYFQSRDSNGAVSKGSWGKEGFVTDNPASDWEPAVAVTPDGAFHVAWDSYRGDYDVFLRSMSRGAWGPEIPLAASPKLENHASLAADAAGRLWIAWEAGPEKWAGDSADGGLRAHRDIEIACLKDGKLYRAGEAEAALRKLGGERGIQAPTIAFGAGNQFRLFFRQPMNTNWLSVGTTTWSENGWSKPEMLLYGEGRIDQKIVTAQAGTKIIAAYPAGSSHNTIYARAFDVSQADLVPPLTSARSLSAKSAPERMGRHLLNGYQLVWGDLHRHTDISEDGGIIDGSLLDTMRYAVDAAGLDFIGITDHSRYLPRRYNQWRMQQIADLLYAPGVFSPMHAYERSQYSPWGHRNIVHLNRDYTVVPGSYDIGDTGVSPDGLFAALRGKKALSIPHTSAWQNKQVSWDYNDPDIERVVEIYQGLRSTYEYNGAPDPAGKAVYEKDSKNFVWNALERKLKLGFIASSDHRSTHMSFAAVYAKNIDRESIFEGLRSRRTYAATDKILLDFSIAKHIMGEEVELPGTPELIVAVEGTGPIAQIDIIKNGKIVYTKNPESRTARFTFRDDAYRGEDAYYYVRVIQADKNMAWASPIWVKSRL